MAYIDKYSINHSKRSWEECEQLWRQEYDRLAKQETEAASIIYKMLSQGSVPSSMPPIGICLTAEEYKRFKAEGRDFKRIHAWCWSGREMHNMVRLNLNTPHMLKTGENLLGLQTPRKGIYKVVGINENILQCYYLADEVLNAEGELDFLDEIVEINSRPLYNYYSSGPKGHELKIGDIIRVLDNQLKKLHLSEGKTYAITWSI